ncbi:hypothetical protein [Agathobacter rectalis]|uniref:hypothetical protein n=1 Tax=Agathobacter rectalis TaxID=39491 RepID=UPI00321A74CA
MKTRQSKRLHNQNVGTTKPVHLHNNEESTMSKYLYYTGYAVEAELISFGTIKIIKCHFFLHNFLLSFSAKKSSF